MARLMADPTTVTLSRPVSGRAKPVTQPVIAPTTPETVLGDRTAGARMRTNTPRRKNRPVGREMAAVLGVSFVVSLLCLYVSAYARVTAEGFELTRLTRKVNAAVAQEQALQASISRQTALEVVAKKAMEMGMVPGQTSNLNMVTRTANPQSPAITSASEEPTRQDPPGQEGDATP